METNPKKAEMCEFTQKHAKISFCSKVRQQKCCKIWKKSNSPNRNQQKQAQKQATRKSS